MNLCLGVCVCAKSETGVRTIEVLLCYIILLFFFFLIVTEILDQDI